ncbi:MAG: aminotransferase class IV [Bacteroidales bacterium]|nr:aminotransferase class IV [Bacteroidales bacterium]
MPTKNFIWLNGNILDGNSPMLFANNRSFLYGDGIFETILAYGTEAKHITLHFARLIKGMKILEIDVPPYLNESFLSETIARLLNKNRLFRNARIRITVFRDTDGLYTPNGNTAGMLIQTQEMGTNFYELNKQGYLIDIYTDIKKPINKLSSVKSCNALLFVKAGLYRKANELDDCIILNEENRVAETVSSNIFIVKGNTIYTPSLAEGCIPGIMREVVCKIAPTLGYEINKQVAFSVKALMDSDEIFLTNSITGIRWVLGVNQNRYFCNVSKKIVTALNKYTFADQFKDGFSG